MGPGFRDYHHNDHDRRRRDDYRVRFAAVRCWMKDVVKTKVKVGVPVRVHYTGSGDAMVVDRVILDED